MIKAGMVRRLFLLLAKGREGQCLGCVGHVEALNMSRCTPSMIVRHAEAIQLSSCHLRNPRHPTDERVLKYFRAEDCSRQLVNASFCSGRLAIARFVHPRSKHCSAMVRSISSLLAHKLLQHYLPGWRD